MSTLQGPVDIYVDIERMGYQDEALPAMWRNEAAFGVSHEQNAQGRRADLLQTVPGENRP
jgi:hypothetical protein